MKARASLLNPYATAYIPLSRREPTEESKGYDPGSTTYESPDSLKLKNHSGFNSYGSSSHSAELAEKQALDVDHDMNLAYLQMVFTGVSDESLSSVYTACRFDMEATVEMLNQLELHSGDFTENLPDSLDIGDVTEAGSSSKGGSQKLKKVAVGEGSSCTPSLKEMSIAELKAKYKKTMSFEKTHAGWKDEYEVSSKQCMHGPKCKVGSLCNVGKRIQVNVLGGGLILPFWGTIEKALSKQDRLSHRRLRVVRIETTTDNNRIVGLYAVVESVLQDLAWVQDIDD